VGLAARAEWLAERGAFPALPLMNDQLLHRAAPERVDLDNHAIPAPTDRIFCHQQRPLLSLMLVQELQCCSLLLILILQPAARDAPVSVLLSRARNGVSLSV
jgi:hypothetical protein